MQDDPIVLTVSTSPHALSMPTDFLTYRPLKRIVTCTIALVICSMPLSVMAHSGGLNADGCHVNRKTGDYHCHRASPAVKDAAASYTHRQNLAPSSSHTRADARSTAAFKNCAQARAAGAAPVRVGDPGYGPHLDRDGDGIGCEPYRGRH